MNSVYGWFSKSFFTLNCILFRDFITVGFVVTEKYTYQFLSCHFSLLVVAVN